MRDKTEQPTPKRLEEARKKGQAPKSRLWTGAAATLGGLTGALLAKEGVTRLEGWMKRLWTSESVDPAEALRGAVELAATLSLPSLLGAAAAGWFASVLASGWQFQPAALAPKLDRIDPGEGLKRLFSFKQLPERARDLALVLILAVWAKAALKDPLSLGFHGLLSPGLGSFTAVAEGLLSLTWRAAALLSGLGIVDLFWARHRHKQSLMMSRDEVRRESKETEGDPHFRSMRRSMHRALAQGGPARGLKSATVLVVNPTHVAVALRYDEGECGAPYLVAKGLDNDAVALKAEARELRIPVVPNIPLARGLYVYDVGEAVPEELYRAAAAVLHAALSSNQE